MHGNDGLPSLNALGRDLLVLPVWRRVLSLVLPFVLVAAFFVLAARGFGIAALACPVILSFITYGSISHDLVHRTLTLPRWLNDVLLSATELIAFRSGHAYRFTHLHHHARFPADDDMEAHSARMSLIGSLLDGVTLQPRLWLFAMREAKRERGWIVGEGVAVLALACASVAIIPITPLPAIYAALMIAGSWIFPVVTVFIPHNAAGTTELTQTRLFRGKVLSVIAAGHLYHLEHHLYPQVPHHHWPQLAHRLDPHFARLKIEPVTLLF
jgi:beta-carotene hydroxylase